VFASLLSLTAAAAPLAAAAQTITAPMGQAVRLPIRGSASDVVVGDPKIADVTVVSPTALFVAGKGHGATNLIVLDAVGRTLFNGRVLVPAADPGQVTIQRGREMKAFFCSPNCDTPAGASAGGGETRATAAASPPMVETTSAPQPQQAAASALR
jgi:hypothetical protein